MKTEIALLQEEYEHLGELKKECEKQRVSIMLRIKDICEHPNFSEPFKDVANDSVECVMCRDCRMVKRLEDK